MSLLLRNHIPAKGCRAETHYKQLGSLWAVGIHHFQGRKSAIFPESVDGDQSHLSCSLQVVKSGQVGLMLSSEENLVDEEFDNNLHAHIGFNQPAWIICNK